MMVRYWEIDPELQSTIDELQQSLAKEEELVSDVVVIAKTIKADGEVGVRTTWSSGCDWLTRRAMIDVAHMAETLKDEDPDHE